MSRFCVNCTNNEVVKRVIYTRGHRVTECLTCRSSDVMAMEATHPDLVTVVHGLIRYHYSEWEYNGHLGGSSIEAILLQENPIFDIAAVRNEDNYLTSINMVEWATSPFVLQCEGYLRAVRLSESPALDALTQRVMDGGEGKAVFIRLLEPHVEQLRSTAVEGLTYFRARKGVAEVAWPMDLEHLTRHYRPYSGGELGAPPAGTSSPGRLNEPGATVLYVASDETTAINEVRPHPGEIVSVGAWTLTRDTTVADFKNVDIHPYLRSESALADYGLLKAVDKLLSRPLPPDQQKAYVVTQALAEALKDLGFAGTAYRSSVAKGVNCAFFDPGALCEVDDSARAVEIESLTYGVVQMTAIDRDREIYLD